MCAPTDRGGARSTGRPARVCSVAGHRTDRHRARRLDRPGGVTGHRGRMVAGVDGDEEPSQAQDPAVLRERPESLGAGSNWVSETAGWRATWPMVSANLGSLDRSRGSSTTKRSRGSPVNAARRTTADHPSRLHRSPIRRARGSARVPPAAHSAHPGVPACSAHVVHRGARPKPAALHLDQGWTAAKLELPPLRVRPRCQTRRARPVDFLTTCATRPRAWTSHLART